MSSIAFSDLIQTLAVLAAVGAALVALYISAKDRRNSREIAAIDRREAFRQSHLMFELEALRRLSENRNRGGSTDPAEVSRMGAEALTLVGILGGERLPTQWERSVGDDAKLRAAFCDPEMPEYKKDALETQLALNAVIADIRAGAIRT